MYMSMSMSVTMTIASQMRSGRPRTVLQHSKHIIFLVLQLMVKCQASSKVNSAIGIFRWAKLINDLRKRTLDDRNALYARWKMLPIVLSHKIFGWKYNGDLGNTGMVMETPSFLRFTFFLQTAKIKYYIYITIACWVESRRSMRSSVLLTSGQLWQISLMLWGPTSAYLLLCHNFYLRSLPPVLSIILVYMSDIFLCTVIYKDSQYLCMTGNLC